MWFVVVCVAFVLSCCGCAAGDFICPTGCTCDAGTLSCQNLTELPHLDDSSINMFTNFFFYDCRLVKLSKFTGGYTSATDLLVINSQLDSVDGDAFDLLDKLDTLELNGNQLKVIPPTLFSRLKNLEKLDLASNKFNELPDGLFKDLTKLREVTLDGNWFGEMGENLFEGSPVALQKLTCNNCHLTAVPAKSLKKIQDLRQLELNQNPFKQLSKDAFSGFEVAHHPLTHLSLDNCSLESIDKTALSLFSNLQHLNLGHNRLTAIPVGTFRHFWNSLSSLFLEHNQLTAVDENLAPWSNMREIKLGYNLWLCDCEMAWIKSIDLNSTDKENITCNAPPDLQGHGLHDEMVRLNCPDRRYYLLIGFGIPILTVVLVSAVCCVLKLTARSSKPRLSSGSVKYRPVYESSSTNQLL